MSNQLSDAGSSNLCKVIGINTNILLKLEQADEGAMSMTISSLTSPEDQKIEGSSSKQIPTGDARITLSTESFASGSSKEFSAPKSQKRDGADLLSSLRVLVANSNASDTLSQSGMHRLEDQHSHTKQSHMPSFSSLAGSSSSKNGARSLKIEVFPRRRNGRNPRVGERSPVVVTEEKLKQCFDLPLHVASKKMGICITAIKKVCRKLGIHKWPYRYILPVLSRVVDSFFLRDLKERKNAAGKAPSEGSYSNIGGITISPEGRNTVPLETLSEASEYARLRGGAAGEDSDSKDSDPQGSQSDQDSKLNTLCIAALELSQSDTRHSAQRRGVKVEKPQQQGKSTIRQSASALHRHCDGPGKLNVGEERANDGSISRSNSISTSDRNSERIGKLLGGLHV
eukprot:765422-Hanusia_phi.AAC.3